MTPVMESAYHAVEMVDRVASRLVEDGAVVELGQLAGLSVDELDLLVRLERSAPRGPRSSQVACAWLAA